MRVTHNTRLIDDFLIILAAKDVAVAILGDQILTAVVRRPVQPLLR